jgi:hypothetical protein
MTATEWATIASLATAVGTLVLAIATFASVRSANYSARAADRAARIAEQSSRIAERSLLAAELPLLMSSRLQDPEQKIQFLEGRLLRVTGGAATLEVADRVVYMVISVRNVGTGLAVMHGWHVEPAGSRSRLIRRWRISPPKPATFTSRPVTLDSGREHCAIRPQPGSRPLPPRSRPATR